MGGERRTAVVLRHGSRTRTLTGTFERTEIAVRRARLMQPDGGTTEWKSEDLRAYLAGVNTRRVRRALAALFSGAVGKDIVSRTWRKVKGDWDVWNFRSLADEPIVRLILDGTVVRVRLEGKATAISLLVVIGVRANGQKVLFAVKSMGSESAEAWRAVLDDLIKRGLRRPEFLIVDGAAGLDQAITAVWDGVPVQRCTVGPLKKSAKRQPYAAISPVMALTSKPTLLRKLRTANGLEGTSQRRRIARRAAASRLRLMAAAVR